MTRSLLALFLYGSVFGSVFGSLLACSGGASDPTAEAASSGSSMKVASGTPLENDRFATTLPDGWEVAADDLDKMGLMTLQEKGSGGKQAVYFKFEKGYTGKPMDNVTRFAEKQNGTPAEEVVRNGIAFARTAYEAHGVKQSLNIAAHDGQKVTLTVMGDDYDTSPEVKAVFDGLELR